MKLDESQDEYNVRLNGEVRDLAERVTRVETENKHQSETLSRIEDKLDVAIDEIPSQKRVEENTTRVDELWENHVTKDNLYKWTAAALAAGASGATIVGIFLP